MQGAPIPSFVQLHDSNDTTFVGGWFAFANPKIGFFQYTNSQHNPDYPNIGVTYQLFHLFGFVPIVHRALLRRKRKALEAIFGVPQTNLMIRMHPSQFFMGDPYGTIRWDWANTEQPNEPIPSNVDMRNPAADTERLLDERSLDQTDPAVVARLIDAALYSPLLNVAQYLTTAPTTDTEESRQPIFSLPTGKNTDAVEALYQIFGPTLAEQIVQSNRQTVVRYTDRDHPQLVTPINALLREIRAQNLDYTRTDDYRLDADNFPSVQFLRSLIHMQGPAGGGGRFIINNPRMRLWMEHLVFHSRRIPVPTMIVVLKMIEQQEEDRVDNNGDVRDRMRELEAWAQEQRERLRRLEEARLQEARARQQQQQQQQPQQRRAGIAFEVHDAFDSLNIGAMVPLLIKEYNFEPYDVYAFVQSIINDPAVVEALQPEQREVLQRKLDLMRSSGVLADIKFDGEIDIDDDGKIPETLLYPAAMHYVHLQPPRYQLQYIQNWLADCTEAYDPRAGNTNPAATMSCVRGAKERMITALAQASAGMEEEGSGATPKQLEEYRLLVNALTPIGNAQILQFMQQCLKSLDAEGVSSDIGDRRNIVLECTRAHLREMGVRLTEDMDNRMQTQVEALDDFIAVGGGRWRRQRRHPSRSRRRRRRTMSTTRRAAKSVGAKVTRRQRRNK